MQKLLTFFQQKISEYTVLCIESVKTVNEMTLNELVNDALNNWALLITDTVVAIYTSRKDLMILKSLPLSH